jgi:predicted transcriptional regulator
MEPSFMTTDTNAIAVELTADIVSAYVSHNALSREDLPGVIQCVYDKLTSLNAPAVEAAPELTPAVPIRKSVTPDYIICLEDGRKLKSMKRHLGKLGMTPDEYRAKWGLPADYPMAAPNYAAIRSRLAKQSGLGRKPEARKVAA